jgi:hypothetical protein
MREIAQSERLLDICQAIVQAGEPHLDFEFDMTYRWQAEPEPGHQVSLYAVLEPGSLEPGERVIKKVTCTDLIAGTGFEVELYRHNDYGLVSSKSEPDGWSNGMVEIIINGLTKNFHPPSSPTKVAPLNQPCLVDAQGKPFDAEAEYI